MHKKSGKLKEDSVEGIWDGKPEKLVGIVVSATLPGVKDKDELFTIQVARKAAEKKKPKKWEKYISKESNWPQFFFAVPDSSNLELTITDRSGKVTGVCEIKVDDLKQNTVVSGEFELVINDKNKKKKPGETDPSGKAEIRVYYSLLTEARPPGPGPHSYNYGDCLSQIKTGDLIVYSGTGMLSSACQLITNSPFSHIGLAVHLPNKWTLEGELYVVELTKNYSKFQDAFKEVAESGINIFRLKERLHQFHGNSPIWWVPLKEPLNPGHQAVLIDWIWKLHRGDQSIEDNIPPISASKMTEFLTARFKLVATYDLMLDFYSPAFAYKALGLAGALEEDMTKYSEAIFASDVVKMPCFDAPVQIRKPAEARASGAVAGAAVASANKDSARTPMKVDPVPRGPPPVRQVSGPTLASYGPGGPPVANGGAGPSPGPPATVPRRPQLNIPLRGPPPNLVLPGMAGGIVAAGVARRPGSGTLNTSHSSTLPSPSGGVSTRLGSTKSLTAPPPLVIPAAPALAPALAPVEVESSEKRREKMMTLSRKFGTSRLAVSSLGIEGNFDTEDKVESAIDAIVAKMRAPNGIPMADLPWQGKIFSKCFLGCDAVDWMVKNKVATTREQAVELANEILVTGRLYHLSRRMAFIDGMEIYRFEIDDVEKLTSDKIPNVFGTSLESIMRRQRMASPDARVPKIMEVLIEAMMNLHATTTEGIFRVPTSLAELEMLRKQFNGGDYACAAMRDAHLPACLLKLWLRDLAEALIPDIYYNNALYCTTPEDRQALLSSLPRDNQNVIRRLFEMVYTLSKHSIVTKMDLNNLAMVFSPCFLRCPATDPLVVMENLPREGMFVRGSFGDYCKARDEAEATAGQEAPQPAQQETA